MNWEELQIRTNQIGGRPGLAESCSLFMPWHHGCGVERNVVILVSGVVLYLQPIAMLEIAESSQLVVRFNSIPVFEVRK